MTTARLFLVLAAIGAVISGVILYGWGNLIFILIDVRRPNPDVGKEWQ